MITYCFHRGDWHPVRERRLIMETSESSENSTPIEQKNAEVAGEDPGELLEGLAKDSESPAKFAIQRIILSFWTEEGKDEAQKIERTVQRLEDVIQSLPSMESETVAHLNATLDRLPHSSATLLRFAIVHKLVDPAMLEAAIKASDIQKSRTAPTANKQEKQETDQGAQADPEKQNEVPLEVLEEQIREARSRIDKMNAARVRMQRDIKHTRLLNARARRYMSPEMRMQQNASMMQEMQKIRSSLGDPVADFHRLRAEFERRTNTSWARYKRGTETNVPMTDAPALPEDARRISLRDEESGEVVGVYDEWTGDFSGSMPRAEAVRIVKNQRNAEQNVDGERAVIMVHAPQYVYRPSPSASESSEWKGEKGSFERYRDVRNFETMMRTNSAYAINTGRRRRLGSFARQAGFADMSEAINSHPEHPSMQIAQIGNEASMQSNAVNRENGLKQTTVENRDEASMLTGERNPYGPMTFRSRYSAPPVESSRQYDARIEHYTEKSLRNVLNDYADLKDDPIAKAVIQNMEDDIKRMGRIDYGVVQNAKSRLDAIRRMNKQLEATNVDSSALHTEYFEAQQPLEGRVDMHIMLPSAMTQGRNRELVIHDPKNWLAQGVFGREDTNLAKRAGISLRPVYASEADGGRITGVDVRFTKPGIYEVGYGSGMKRRVEIDQPSYSDRTGAAVEQVPDETRLLQAGKLRANVIYDDAMREIAGNTYPTKEKKSDALWSKVEEKMKASIIDTKLHRDVEKYVRLERMLAAIRQEGGEQIDENIRNLGRAFGKWAAEAYPRIYKALAE